MTVAWLREEKRENRRVGMLSFIVVICFCVEVGLDEGSVSSADCLGYLSVEVLC
jgi:hypothetical protein